MSDDVDLVDGGRHGETERLPWCDNCGAFAVPTDQNECGECGEKISWREETI